MRQLRIKKKYKNSPNNKLTLVKAVKVLTGLGLREAKDLCDNYLDYSEELIIDTNLSQEDIKEQNDYLIDHGYIIDYMGHLERDKNIAEALAIFRFTVFHSNEKVLVSDGSFEVNDVTGKVEIVIKEGTLLKEHDVTTLENKKYILHITQVFIEEEL